MFGARSGGLREMENLSFEMAQSYLPPDCNAGKENEDRIKSNLKERYFKLPPSKRVNYTKLAINSPFICPWNILLSDWTDQTVKEFFVLRDWRLLESIQVCLLFKVLNWTSLKHLLIATALYINLVYLVFTSLQIFRTVSSIRKHYQA